MKPNNLSQFPPAEEGTEDSKMPTSNLISEDILTAVADFCFPNDISITRIDFDQRQKELNLQ